MPAQTLATRQAASVSHRRESGRFKAETPAPSYAA